MKDVKAFSSLVAVRHLRRNDEHVSSVHGKATVFDVVHPGAAGDDINLIKLLYVHTDPVIAHDKSVYQITGLPENLRVAVAVPLVLFQLQWKHIVLL